MNVLSAQGAVHDAARYWGWYLALGVVLIVAGIAAVWVAEAATLASIVAIGVVLLVTGIAQLVSAFFSRGAGHIILLLLIGVLDLIVGTMLVQHPAIGALTITLLLAALLMFGGLFRIISALWLQFPHYGWVVGSGVLTFVLGILLWLQWPFSAMWFIGFVVGINLVFAGAAWCAMATRLRAL